MPTVVIIHAAEDTLPARALADKLRQAKLTVVLEKQAGEELRAAAKGANVCVALWSPRSGVQPGLVEDAEFAAGKSKIVHVVMQSAQVPEPFRQENSVNLTGWRGEDDFPGWRQLAKAVTEKAGVAPLPPPPPRPPSGFFQPGAAAPAQPAAPPRAAQASPARAAPRSPSPAQRAAPTHATPEPKSGGGMILAAAAFAVVALVGAGGYFLWSRSQAAHTTSAAWEEVERNDAASLRAFIDSASGDYRSEALAALAELEERTFEAASDADTIEALEAFLSEFPESEHAITVRGRMAELQTLPQPPGEAVALPIEEAPAESADPDLVPPAAEPVAPVPEPGPAAITPPAPEPTVAPSN